MVVTGTQRHNLLDETANTSVAQVTKKSHVGGTEAGMLTQKLANPGDFDRENLEKVFVRGRKAVERATFSLPLCFGYGSVWKRTCWKWNQDCLMWPEPRAQNRRRQQQMRTDPKTDAMLHSRQCHHVQTLDTNFVGVVEPSNIGGEENPGA